MSDHRHLHDMTTPHAPPDDFRPADAIESLRAAILRVDTIAQVASDAVDELRYPGDTAAGRAFGGCRSSSGKRLTKRAWRSHKVTGSWQRSRNTCRPNEATRSL